MCCQPDVFNGEKPKAVGLLITSEVKGSRGFARDHLLVVVADFFIIGFIIWRSIVPEHAASTLNH